MTKAKWTGVLTSLMVVLAVALNARADQAKPKASPSQTYAVLVGISEYADQQIKPRPHAEADVKALYDLFTNKDYLGLDDQHLAARERLQSFHGPQGVAQALPTRSPRR